MNPSSPWTRTRQEMARLVYAFLAHAREFDPDNALIICADPRGGSTWLSEAIAQFPHTSTIWEPLHLTQVGYFRDAGLGWQQHIPAQAEWPEAHDVFERLFRGQLLNGWLLSQTSLLRHLRARQLIFKFCRAHGLLPWLTESFAFRHAPIHLVRHPCAVVASQLRHGAWDRTRNRYNIPRGRYQDIYDPYRPFTRTLSSPEDILLAQWCVNNKFLLETAAEKRRWLGITYEELVQDREAQLTRIEDSWGRRLPAAARQQLTKPSVTSVAERRQLDATERTAAWASRFSSPQLASMQRILDAFEITLYRTDSPDPQHAY